VGNPIVRDWSRERTCGRIRCRKGSELGMKDYFAILGVDRRPWLDLEVLKGVFHRLAAEAHPDARVAGGVTEGEEGGFVELNLAYRVLRDPVSRLGHLLELEGVSPGGGAEVDSELGELFMEVGVLGREVRGYLGRRSAVSSGLEKALLASESASLVERMERLGASVEKCWGDAETVLQELDARWGRQRDGETLGGLVLLRRRLAVLARWREQIGEFLFILKNR
jgi:hypothetical protein